MLVNQIKHRLIPETWGMSIWVSGYVVHLLFVFYSLAIFKKDISEIQLEWLESIISYIFTGLWMLPMFVITTPINNLWFRVWFIYLSIHLSICLSIYLCACISIYHKGYSCWMLWPYEETTTWLEKTKTKVTVQLLYIYANHVNIYISIYLSIYPSIHPSIYLCTCMYVCMYVLVLKQILKYWIFVC